MGEPMIRGLRNVLPHRVIFEFFWVFPCAKVWEARTSEYGSKPLQKGFSSVLSDIILMSSAGRETGTKQPRGRISFCKVAE